MIKIDRGLEACHRVREQTDTIALKFSGGKDSLSMWLRCREIFPNIVPIFHYWVPGLKFVERTLVMYEDFFQTKIIRAPMPNFLTFLKHGAYQYPHRWNVVEQHALGDADFDEITEWICEDIGLENYWIAVGIKTNDPPVRRRAIDTHGAWTPDKRLFYPVADLKKDDLIDLIDRYNAPVSEDYAVFGRSFDGLQFRYMDQVKKHYPEDYETICRWFPLVEAEFMRRKAYAAQVTTY